MNNKCTATTVCDLLRDRVTDSGKGFKAFHTVRTTDRTSSTLLLGVAYKTSAKDPGLLLNWCPFCGGQPGYFERDCGTNVEARDAE